MSGSPGNANLNAPTLAPIPSKFRSDPEVFAYLNQLETWKQQVYRLLDQGNFSTDDIPPFTLSTVGALIEEMQDLQYQNQSLQQQIAEIETGFNALASIIDEELQKETPQYNQINSKVTVSSASNITAIDVDLVIATDAITVTLDPNPEDLHITEVKRVTTAGAVAVDGNGNNIDGSSTFTMSSNYDGYTFIYSQDAGEWLII